MLRLIAIAALLALIAAAPAQAGWKTDRSLAIAEAVWHPACGALSLAYGDAERAGAPASASAWAWEGNCTITIANGLYLEFEELCTIVLHEAGHVTGLGHSSNPRSVMYGEPLVIKTTATIARRTVTKWTGVDRRCLKRGRPFLYGDGTTR